MRIDTVKTEVYKFAELNDEAKEKAITNYQENQEYFYADDNRKSLDEFCNLLGITDIDYSYGDYGRDYIKFTMPTFDYYYDEDILELTGIRLQKYLYNNFYDYLVKGKFYSIGHYDENNKYSYKSRYSKISKDWKDCPLTGYCMDHDLIKPIMDYLESIPDKHTTIEDVFKDCLDNWLSACTADYESVFEDDYISDHITANDYEFTVDGSMY